MRYDNFELRDMLAADYAIGHLKGAARTRYEKLQLDDPEWQRLTMWWLDRIHLLAQTIQPVRPGARVWRNIEWRLFGVRGSRSFFWWRSLAVFSTLLAVTFAALFVRNVTDRQFAPQAMHYALLQNESAVPGWIVTLDRRAEDVRYLRVAALPKLDLAPANAYELWMLPPGERAPVSLGLLPQTGVTEFAISDQAADELMRGALAVSLEPPGGSPTGQPTGPVLFQGKPGSI